MDVTFMQVFEVFIDSNTECDVLYLIKWSHNLLLLGTIIFAAKVERRLSLLIKIYVDFGARSRYLRQG